MDEATFELAQKRLAIRTRPTKIDEIAIFQGCSTVLTAVTKCTCREVPAHWNESTLILVGATATGQEVASNAPRIISASRLC